MNEFYMTINFNSNIYIHHANERNRLSSKDSKYIIRNFISKYQYHKTPITYFPTDLAMAPYRCIEINGYLFYWYKKTVLLIVAEEFFILMGLIRL